MTSVVGSEKSGQKQAGERGSSPSTTAGAAPERSPEMTLEAHRAQNEAVRAEALIANMREVLRKHKGRHPQPLRGGEVRQMNLTLPSDLVNYLDAEVRRLNEEEGRAFSGKITRTDLINRALKERLPLELYEDFVAVVISRRKLVGRLEVSFKAPAADADALAEIGVVIPRRRIALAPKAVAEALVYAWATAVNTDNLFKLHDLPTTGRGRGAKRPQSV